MSRTHGRPLACVAMIEAFVHQINISGGGVPKLPVDGRVDVYKHGMHGDVQNDKRHHGGPLQTLCLYSLEVIQALQHEGHPIEAGSAGENVTISGLDWDALEPGDRLKIGATLVAELTLPATPCAKNAGWFSDRDYHRIDGELYPGSSRWYARVLAEGAIETGDPVRHERPFLNHRGDRHLA